MMLRNGEKFVGFMIKAIIVCTTAHITTSIVYIFVIVVGHHLFARTEQ